MMRFGLCFLSALAICASLHAGTIDVSSFTGSATMINFDNVIGGNHNLSGPSITTQYSALGVVFNNPSYPGQDTADTNLTFGVPGSSFPNALYVAQGGHIGDPPAMPFQIVFSSPVTMVGFDYGSSLNSFLRVDVYDATNTLLDSLTYTGQPSAIGLGGFAGIQEATAIQRLDVSYHPNSEPNRTYNFSIDNLEFQGPSVAAGSDPPVPDPPVTDPPVPEPSTFALMAIGCLGIILHRRRGSRLRLRPVIPHNPPCRNDASFEELTMRKSDARAHQAP